MKTNVSYFMIIILFVLLFSNIGYSQIPPIPIPPTSPTLHVDANSPNIPGTGTFSDPFRTIQSAINNSSSPHTILVRSGVYNEDIVIDNTSNPMKTLNIQSQMGSINTEIKGTGTTSTVLFLNANSSCRLIGFTITNGIGDSVHGFWGRSGGGVSCIDSSPLISYNIIKNNTARDGGGIYCRSTGYQQNPCAPCITDNTIMDNTASDNTNGYGGGICAYTIFHPLKITNNTISNNEAKQDGGGVYLFGGAGGGYDTNVVIIEKNIFSNNIALNGGGVYTLEPGRFEIRGNGFIQNHSNGLYLYWKTTLGTQRDVIENNYFYQNGAGIDVNGVIRPGNQNGGGVYIEINDPIMRNNVYYENVAKTNGGGLYYLSPSPTGAGANFTGETFSFIIRNSIICYF